MHAPLPRLALATLLVAVTLPCVSLRATPADDLSRAIQASGAIDSTNATREQFLPAFLALVVKAKAHELPALAAAAVSARVDFAEDITRLSIQAAPPTIHSAQKPASLVERIVLESIQAAPDAAEVIVRAAIAAAPECSLAIVEAGSAAAPGRAAAMNRIAAEQRIRLAMLRAMTPPGISVAREHLAADRVPAHTPVASPEKPPRS